MNAIWLIAFLTCMAVAVTLLALLRKFERARNGGVQPNLAKISAARYRPMARLLDPAEEAFLAQHADRGTIRRFRAERRRIFRGYLRSLERDFGSICGGIRLVLVHSPEDRPDLAAALMRREAGFAMALFSVHCRLILHAAGIGTVDVRDLVGALDAMRLELGNLVPNAATAAA
ncbi:MAG TPA: hypothetical protein VN442_19755 [Bryobacteraceae bacterium]|nr:hypothetical protein [Bryobacteraceae bacterium]